MAQHCLRVSSLAQEFGFDHNFQLVALHHDDAEAYLRDIPSPVKRFLPAIKAAEESILCAVMRKWKMKDIDWKALKKLDRMVGAGEEAVWMPRRTDTWGVATRAIPNYTRMPVLDATVGKQLWLAVHETLLWRIEHGC